jgi:hypothetical protein
LARTKNVIQSKLTVLNAMNNKSWSFSLSNFSTHLNSSIQSVLIVSTSNTDAINLGLFHLAQILYRQSNIYAIAKVSISVQYSRLI